MIELELKRIADALEKMAAMVERMALPVVTIQSEQLPAFTPPVAPTEEAIPGVEEPKIMALQGIDNATALRSFVQTCLTQAEKAKKAAELVTFVRDVVCKKFSPKEPKLLKIPDGKVAEAAKMVYDWMVSNGVSLN